jgi:hypothetical protein
MRGVLRMSALNQPNNDTAAPANITRRSAGLIRGIASASGTVD